MTWEEFAYIFYSFSSNGWIFNIGTPECQACVSPLSFTHRPCTYSLHVLDKFTDNRIGAGRHTCNPSERTLVTARSKSRTQLRTQTRRRS